MPEKKKVTNYMGLPVQSYQASHHIVLIFFWNYFCTNFKAPVKRGRDGWEARVYMRVFSTLIPQSNENKSSHESWEARVCMRVFSTPTCLSQTRTRVAWELRRDSLHESFLNSQLSCSGQTRTRVAWKLMTVYSGYYRDA
jgi:hypothetical protein